MFDLEDVGPLIEGDAVIILDGGVSLVRHLDLAATHLIDLAFLKYLMVLPSSLVEESRIDLAVSAVNKIDIEQVPLPFGIVPRSHRILLGDTHLDGPVMSERVEARHRDEACVIVAAQGHSLV